MYAHAIFTLLHLTVTFTFDLISTEIAERPITHLIQFKLSSLNVLW